MRGVDLNSVIDKGSIARASRAAAFDSGRLSASCGLVALPKRHDAV
jgi:hypothetical protein